MKVAMILAALTVLYLVVCVILARLKSLKRLGEDYELFIDGGEE